MALDSSKDTAEHSESYSSTLIIVDNYRKLAAILRYKELTNSFSLAFEGMLETTDLALDSSEDTADRSESYSSTLIIVDNYRKLAANLR